MNVETKKNSRWSIFSLALTLLISACGSGVLADPQMLGTYHLPDVVDEVNLTLREDNTFRWRIVGCDFGREGEGRWVAEGEGMRLHPNPGKAHLSWAVPSNNQTPVTTLSAARTGDDLRIVSSDSEETWKRGRICARCGTTGYLGPSGLDICEDQTGL